MPFDRLQADDPEQWPFDARQIDRVVLQDVTAQFGGSGENELYIDDFQVY